MIINWSPLEFHLCCPSHRIMWHMGFCNKRNELLNINHSHRQMASVGEVDEKDHSRLQLHSRSSNIVIWCYMKSSNECLCQKITFLTSHAQFFPPLSPENNVFFAPPQSLFVSSCWLPKIRMRGSKKLHMEEQWLWKIGRNWCEMESIFS